MWRERLLKKNDNAIAGLYPFAKLWILTLYCCIVVILSTADVGGYPVFMMAALAVPVALAAASGVLGGFLKSFRALCVLAGIILITQSVLFPGPDALLRLGALGPFTVGVYKNGLIKGLRLGFSVLDLGGIFIWFFKCTANRDLVCALEKKGMSPKAGYVLLSTLQIIPALQKSAKAVMDAQEARGIDTRGSLRARMRAFLSLLVPVVMGAVTSAEERALTLESRGFTARCKKTRLLDAEPNGKEKTAVAFATLAAALALAWRVLIWAV